MAGYNMTFDIPKIIGKFKSSIDARKFLTELALSAIRLNRMRILKSINLSGSKMKAYSDSYSRKKRLSGRSNKPNLTLTGNLLKSMGILIIDVVKLVAIVGFAGASTKTKLRASAGKRVKKHGDNVKYHKNFTKATRYVVSDTHGNELNKTKAWFNLKNNRDSLGLSLDDKKKLKAFAKTIIKKHIK